MPRKFEKPVILSPEEFDLYIDDVCEQTNFDRITYVPLGESLIKKGEYNSIKFDSKWEAAFYIFKHDIECLPILRNNQKTGEFVTYYSESGGERKFFPDFILGGNYVEIKGRWRPDDYRKMEQHPEIEFIDATKMKPILKEVFKRYPEWEKSYLPIL
jgi:hypothetical protein